MLTTTGSRRGTIVGIVVAALLMSGCASPGEPQASPTPASTPAPTSTPRPTPTAEPEVASIVIGGSEFTTVLADGTVRDTVPFSSDPQAVVALLTELFESEPVVADVAEEHCSPSFTRADWSGAVKLDTEFDWLPEGQRFVILASAPVHHGIALTSTVGKTVGDDASDLIATLPAEQIQMYEWEGETRGSVAYAVEGGGFPPKGYDAWGALVLVESNLITDIAAPASFVSASIC
jgi:hypothetical protein